MTDDSLLYQSANAKRKIVKDCIRQCIGSEPTLEEKRKFTIIHRLNETRIYFKGELIAHLRYYVKESVLFAEYLYVK